MQESCNGAYLESPDRKTVNGCPLFVHITGTRFLYYHPNGRWMAAASRAAIASGMGLVRSASCGDPTPAQAAHWQVQNGTDWMTVRGATSEKMTGTYVLCAIPCRAATYVVHKADVRTSIRKVQFAQKLL